MQCSAVVKDRFLRRKLGRINISLDEPDPVVYPIGREIHWTKAVLDIIWESCSSTKRLRSLSNMILDVRVIANAHTYYATSTLYEQPSEKLLLKDSEVRKRNRPVFLSKWQIPLLGSQDIADGETQPAVWTPTFSRSIRIPVPVRTGWAPAPTFCSSLAAQRYTLEVMVNIRGLSHDALSLKAPLQIKATCYDAQTLPEYEPACVSSSVHELLCNELPSTTEVSSISAHS